MGYALPSGVINTDSAYFYAGATTGFGAFIKQPKDQTLVILDYSNLSPAIVIEEYEFTVDVSSNPTLAISYPVLNSESNVLSFLVSGGIKEQQYNITITLNSGGTARSDILTVNIPSSGDCDCQNINPVPEIYTQLPLGSDGYINTGVRFFWGGTAPANPGALDQWYNSNTQTLYEYVTDGVNYFWQVLASPSIVTDAPVSGLIYGRYNGYWVPDPIQFDAPQDGFLYARNNGLWRAIPASVQDAPATNFGYMRYNNGWVQVPIQTDAPQNGTNYARSNGAWTQLLPIIPEAPQNNQFFARINSNWQPVAVQTDAPPDGQFYVRQNYSWVPLIGYNQFLVDAPTDGTLYGRQDGAWVAAYPASNPASYTTTAQVTAVANNLMPKNGGVFTGGVQFNIGAVFPTASQLFIGGGQPGQLIGCLSSNQTTWINPGPAEAPMDGVAYARENGAWVPTASGSGLPDAPNDGTAYARKSQAWANLSHNDITDWTATLAPYALITSVPLASTTLPVMDGTAAVGVGTTWARADHVHPIDTSRYAANNPSNYQTNTQVTALITAALGPYALASAIPAPYGVLPAMNGVASAGNNAAYSRGDHVHPTDTTRLAIAGGTMTGILTLASNPVNVLDAVPKQYVDTQTNSTLDMGTF